MPSENDVAYYPFGERIFAGNADELSAGVEPYFKAGPPHTVVFDLERVKLCDSCGLRLFLNLQRLADAGNKKMILYRPDHIFKDLLETTRLVHVFTVTDTLDPALAAALGR
jgi:anti-anti-sigma factor